MPRSDERETLAYGRESKLCPVRRNAELDPLALSLFQRLLPRCSRCSVFLAVPAWPGSLVAAGTAFVDTPSLGDEPEAAPRYGTDKSLHLPAIVDRATETIRPSHTLSISSSFETTRSRFSIKYFSTPKTWGSTGMTSPSQ
jgi:hypothetical protein